WLPPWSLVAESAPARASLPATSTCTGWPISLAAVSALLVASLSVLLSCSARRSVVMSAACHGKRRHSLLGRPRMTPIAAQSSKQSHFVFELVDELSDRLDLHARLASRGFRGLEYFQARRDVDPIAIGGFLVDRFFLRLHDIRQACIARLVET